MAIIERLTFTPSKDDAPDEHPHTMVLMVNVEMYERYQKDKSIAVADVVDSFDIFMYDAPGKNGKLGRPSKRELSDVFGTTKEDEIAAFMLEKGRLEGRVH